MKLHKSIRKYAKFDLNKLDELIEIESYESIKTTTDSNYIIETYKVTEPYMVDGTKCKAEIFKHKNEDSYLIALYTKNVNVYCYTNKEFSVKNRDRKPAVIKYFKSSFGIYSNPHIELLYYKKDIYHNDFGPAKLLYIQKLNEKSFTLINIEFLKNGLKYNKNGIVFYYKSLIDNTIYLSFIKNNEYTSYEYGYSVYINKYDLSQNNEHRIHISRNYSSKILELTHFDNTRNVFHRLNGPAFINKSPKEKTNKKWYIYGKYLPDDIIHYEKGLEKDITKTDILKAMLFDQEYGKFLQEKFNEVAQIN